MRAAFLIAPATLTRHLPAATYERGLDTYRRQQVLDYTLSPASRSEWRIEGEVQGSERQPHECSVLLELDAEGRIAAFGSDCSCAVGSRCRHAVALTLKAAYKSGTVQGAEPPSPRRPDAAPPPPGAAPLLGLFDDVLPPPAPAPDGDLPLYLLQESRRSPREPARPLLAWRLARPLKRGGWGRVRAPDADTMVRLGQPGSPLSAADRDCLARIGRLGGAFYLHSASGLLQGAEAAPALEAAARTGRLFAADAEGRPHGAPLRWGPPRDLAWHWSPTRLGDAPAWALQAALAEPGEGRCLYAALPPLYLDRGAQECGPVHAGAITPEQLTQLLTAGPLPQFVFDDPDADLLPRRLGLPLPAAGAGAQTWPTTAPQPCLRLRPVPAGERAARGLLCALLDFDYGGPRGHWPEGQPQVLAEHEGRPVLLQRDLGAELHARHRLQALGLTADALGRWHLGFAATWLDWAAAGWAPLVQAGFRVEPDAVLRGLGEPPQRLELRIVEPTAAEAADGGQAAATADGEHTASPWFDLSLGIEIDGERHNVLPWLPGLLAQVEPGPDGPQLPEWLWREQADGRWLRLPSAPLAPWLQALLDLVAERPPQDWQAPETLRLTPVEALRIGATLGDGVVWEGADRLRELLRQLGGDGALPTVAPPAGLQASLRPYQQQGLDWLQFLRRHRLGGILADDMGLGKTLQTLAHLLREKEDGRLDRPCLVLAPLSLLGNWRREAARFAPALRTAVWHGPQRHGRGGFGGTDLVIAPYSLLPRDRVFWQKQAWHVVVLDEAQQIKNADSQVAQVAASLEARQRVALSGTPLENHLGELWSLFHFLMPGFLGSQARFREVFRTPIERHGDSACLAQLRKRVTPFLLRRTKQNVAKELPDKIETLSAVTLEGPQADLYETIRLATERQVRESLAERGLARSQIQVLDALLKLRQVCCDPRLVKSLPAAQQVRQSAKLEWLMDVLPEMLEEGRRVLLFSQFTSMLALIESALRERGLRWTTLTGQTTDREAAIARFTRGDVPLFLISLKAGGAGLNLPEADTVIHYDPWWNPAVEAQATARAHRIGQQRQVMVYKLVAEGTIEERILAMQARKAALSQGLLEGGASGDRLLFTEDDVALLLRPLGS
ncbi:DEAD/DEAH box helicase [Pseudacidovorax sp. RU35E]|uniref:DEAD/DEAH box helicase n=1 Tax=Pseudacidovorax sp. RU35E TaxID=1907403 RepID=UPI0009545AF3|nr:DEAD/DEAH box helicase [Pseudacidovorax sp. RU35E]SIR56941.1 Helicase conserved C-terminal domain-containing protein [Pseudacidovorax sp. RU35E]